MKIATWNVNSIRVRLPQVLEWLADSSPDVLVLQEIKTINAEFPGDAIAELGYQVSVNGQKTYNGVAILSKTAQADVLTDIPTLHDEQRRILVATIAGVRIINLYVPNGQSVGSEKFAYKLEWLSKVTQYIQSQMQTYEDIVVLGDFNIAPANIDVYDPQAWQGKVLFSDQEHQALEQLLNLGLLDVFRELYPERQEYSWWDYRMAAFRRNLGLRIDLILASPVLQARCISCTIDKEARKAERPSDHAPVVAQFGVL